MKSNSHAAARRIKRVLKKNFDALIITHPEEAKNTEHIYVRAVAEVQHQTDKKDTKAINRAFAPKSSYNVNLIRNKDNMRSAQRRKALRRIKFLSSKAGAFKKKTDEEQLEVLFEESKPPTLNEMQRQSKNKVEIVQGEMVHPIRRQEVLQRIATHSTKHVVVNDVNFHHSDDETEMQYLLRLRTECIFFKRKEPAFVARKIASLNKLVKKPLPIKYTRQHQVADAEKDSFSFFFESCYSTYNLPCLWTNLAADSEDLPNPLNVRHLREFILGFNLFPNEPVVNRSLLDNWQLFDHTFIQSNYDFVLIDNTDDISESIFDNINVDTDDESSSSMEVSVESYFYDDEYTELDRFEHETNTTIDFFYSLPYDSSHYLFESDIKEEENEVDICSDSFYISMLTHITPLLGEFPFFGTIFAFLYQLYSSRNTVDYIAAVYQFANIVVGKFPDVMCIANDLLREAFKTWTIYTQSMSSTLESFFLRAETVISSDLLVTLRDFIVAVTSFKLFEKKTAGIIFSLLGSIKCMSLLDFIPLLIQMILKSVRFCEALFQGIPLSEYLLSSDPVRAAINELHTLLPFKDFLYQGLPIEGYMCQRDFLFKIQTINQLLEVAMSKTVRFSAQYRNLQETWLKSIVVYNTINNKIAGTTRMTPFAFVLYGDPGVGKGRLLPYIFKKWSEIKGREFHDSQVFHRVLDSDYVEGYNPRSHFAWHYAELGCKAKKLTESQGDKAVMEMTALIDSNPYLLNMAAVDLKGTVYADPEIVGADTNSPNLNLPLVVNNAAAFYRRLMFIGVTVKSEFRLDNSTALDPRKALAAGGNVMDRYEFNVTKRLPNGKAAYTEVTLLAKGNIVQFDDLLKEKFSEHLNIELNVLKSLRPELAVVESASLLNSNFFVEFCCSFFESFAFIVSYLWIVIYDQLRLKSNAFLDVFINFFLNIIVIIFCLVLILTLNIFTCILPHCFNLIVIYIRKFIVASIVYRINIITLVFSFTDTPVKLLESNFHYTKIAATFSAAVMMFLFCYHRFKKECNKTESDFSRFIKDPVITEQIHIVEDKINANHSYTRVAIKDSLLWNVKEDVVISPVCKNSPADVVRTIMRNCKKIIIVGKKKVVTCVLGIRGDLVLVNKHALQMPLDGKFVFRFPGNGDIDTTDVWRDTVVAIDDVIHFDGDLSLIRVNHMHFSDITDYFIIKNNNETHSCAGFLGNVRVRARFCPGTISARINNDLPPVIITTYWGYSLAEHSVGLCGTPLMVETGGGISIVGIHSAGVEIGEQCFATTINYNMVQKAVQTEQSTRIFHSLHSEGVIATESLTLPGVKSPFRFEPLHNLRYFGKRPVEIHLPSKSKLILTPFAKHAETIFGLALRDEAGKPLFGAPPMRPFIRDGIYYSPFNNAMRRMSKNNVCLNHTLLQKITIELIDRFSINGISICPLTVDGAINGVKSDVFARRLNASTGSGCQLGGKKHLYLPITFEDETEIIREPTALLKEQILNFIQNYSEGRTNCAYYTGNLKDEARGVEKNIIGNTRMFFSQSLVGLIVSRMFLHPFYMLMQQFPKIFCTAIGIDMHTGADALVSSMLNFGEKILEWDLKDYQYNVPFEIILTTNTIILNSLKNLGYNELALVVSNGILTEGLFPLVVVNGDVFSASSLQPSGKLGTAEDNSIRHLVLLMYIWYSISTEPFFKNILSVLYGDDGLAVLSDFATTILNNKILIELFFKQLNMIATPAMKGEFVQAYMSIKEVSFLKRNFVFSNTLHKWTAPLQLESIVKSVILFIPSKNVSREKQLIDSVVSSMWEWFFHCDSEEKYASARQQWITILNERLEVPTEDLEDRIPTYDVLFGKFALLANDLD